MLKFRVMPTLLYAGSTLVKGIAFDSWRPVGAAMQAIKVYNLRQVDELVFLDIRATRESRGPDLALIGELADECFAPLTVGGGVSTVDDVRGLLRAGADKVAINSAAVHSPALVSQVADAFGSQCVVVSIDAKREPDTSHQVYTHSGSSPTGRSPTAVAIEAERAGAGEILLTSIDRDGSMAGYDIELVESVAASVGIPVIASGGAGRYEDFRTAITEGGASAVAAAAMYHFTEQTPLEAKRYLAKFGIPVRL
jgi:cyclase